jgi:hypothetical protein
MRAEIAALVRQGQRAEAARQLKGEGAADLANRKAILLHITATKGICNRCKQPIGDAEEGVCGICNALNLNW